MKDWRKLADKYALAAAIFIGAAGYPLFRRLTPLLPTLIFFMLFFTFCKVNPLDLRLHKWHFIALSVQLALAAGVYFLLISAGRYFPVLENRTVAQSAMLCFLMPTATAAPIVAGKLGGSIQNLTTFTLLSNLATAVIVPVFFPIVNPIESMTFTAASLLILRRVTPLLLGPFLLAWLVRIVYDRLPRNRRAGKVFILPPDMAQVPFYLWACTIVILMGDIVYSLLTQPSDMQTLSGMIIWAAVSCFIQFALGRAIGKRWPAGSHGTDYQDAVINPATAPKTKSGISRLTAGQALGQKNTTLAIWMAQTYLLPLTAVGPAIYMIVQNLFNSAQLAKAAKAKDSTVRC